MPVPFGTYDKVVLAGSAIALLSWVAVPDMVATGVALLLAGAAAREIVAGRNWRNLKVVVLVVLLLAANLAFHIEAGLTGSADVARRFAEEAIRAQWETYLADFRHPAHLCFGALKARLATLLAGAARDADDVIDFGAFCALPDYETAHDFPRVRFIGVDLQRETERLNALAFPAENLVFHAGEITDFITTTVRPERRTALVHARTATLCYPAFLRRLYAACAAQGVREIHLFGNASIERETDRLLPFAAYEGASRIFKNGQFIHDYPRLLGEAGYSVVESSLIPSPNATFEVEDLGNTHVRMRAVLSRP